MLAKGVKPTIRDMIVPAKNRAVMDAQVDFGRNTVAEQVKMLLKNLLNTK